MSFVRPEVAAAVQRWRETLVGIGALALGLWFAWTSFGALFLIGVVLAIGGGALALAGIQRARFRTPAEGPGIVKVDEGRIVYFGPWGGGSVALDRLGWLELAPSGRDRPDWIFIEEDGHRLEVPADAAGADALFDVFAALPGMPTERMLSLLSDPVRERTVIWQRDLMRLH